MTGTIYLYTDKKQEGKAAAEWTDLENNRFFYSGTQQKNAPSGTTAVGAVYKSIKMKQVIYLFLSQIKTKEFKLFLDQQVK